MIVLKTNDSFTKALAENLAETKSSASGSAQRSAALNLRPFSVRKFKQHETRRHIGEARFENLKRGNVVP